MIGLGRMGGNMARRLLAGGHAVVAYDRSEAAVADLASAGARAAGSVAELVERLTPPRAVWLSLPAGAVTEGVLGELEGLLAPGDAVIDAGNAHYQESMARGERLAARGIDFVDQGTSGGVWGLENGYCLMVGATEEAFRRLEPAFATLAPPEGYRHVGPVGAGHYVKMVHNGIEYGLMQAYAEGFELLASSRFPGLDLGAIAHLWNQGSVVRSWLLELAERAFDQDPRLDGLTGWVDDSGEGRWTVVEAIDQAVPTPVLALALFMRFRSRQADSFAGKVLAALRNEFGGHAVHKAPGGG
jgi:6-phosphogluconate dehydrogenase